MIVNPAVTRVIQFIIVVTPYKRLPSLIDNCWSLSGIMYASKNKRQESSKRIRSLVSKVLHIVFVSNSNSATFYLCDHKLLLFQSEAKYLGGILKYCFVKLFYIFEMAL